MSLSSSNYAPNETPVSANQNNDTSSSSSILTILNEGIIAGKQFDKARSLAKQLSMVTTTAEQIKILTGSMQVIAELLRTKASPHPFTILAAEFFHDTHLFFLRLFEVKQLMIIFGKGLDQKISARALIEESYSLPIRLKILKELDDAVLNEVFKTFEGYQSLNMVSIIVGSTSKLNIRRFTNECSNWLAVIDKEIAESKTQPEELTRYAFKRLGNKYLGDQLTDNVDHYRSDKTHDLHLMALETIDAEYLQSVTPTAAVLTAIISNIEYGYTKQNPSPIQAHTLLLEKLGKDHLKNIFNDPEALKTFMIKLDSRAHSKLEELLELNVQTIQQAPQENYSPKPK